MGVVMTGSRYVFLNEGFSVGVPMTSSMWVL